MVAEVAGEAGAVEGTEEAEEAVAAGVGVVAVGEQEGEEVG